jgi:predicted DNA-binding transcriptional regulator AlpA
MNRMQTNAPDDLRIYRPRELSARIGLSLPTIWRMRHRGELPEPVRLSPGAVGWPATQIQEWLDARDRQRAGHHHRGVANREG